MALIIILSVFLTGCNMFVVNAERDGDQVVATVAHNGITSEITKSEYMEYYNSNYQMYTYYYGYTAEETGELLLSTMAKQKMIVILAREQFAKEKGIEVNPNFDKTNKYKGYDEYAAHLMSLLNPDEQKWVKDRTNKSFEEGFDELVKELVEQEKLANEVEEDKEENKDKLKPRPIKEKKEETEFKPDSSITQGDVDKVQDFFTAKKPNADSTKFEKEAYEKIEKNMKNQFRSYYYYLVKQAEARLVGKYSESHDIYEGDVNVDMKYKLTLNEQKQLYKQASSYKSAYDSATAPIIYNNGRYVKVKSILLKFNDTQSAYWKSIQEKYAGDQYASFVNEMRSYLVFGDTFESIDDILAKMPFPITEEQKKELLGLKVNISNPEYTADMDESEAFTKKNVPFLEVIQEMGKAIKKAGEDASIEYDEKFADNNAQDANVIAGKKMYVAQKKIEKFEEWIYLVNDDDGMFKGKDYVETPYEQKSDYVTEYTALVRQLLIDKDSVGAVAVNQNGAGQEYEVTNGDTITVGTIESTTVKVQGKDVTIYTEVDGDISFIINEFGVHIVMLTDVPFAKDINTEGEQFTIEENADFDMEPYANYDNDTKNLIKKHNSFYTYKLNAFVSYDEETGKALTLEEYLHNTMKESYEKNVYNQYEKSLFDWYGEDVFDTSDDKDKVDNSAIFEVKLNKSVFNGFKSTFKKLDKAMEEAKKNQQ